MVFESDIQNLKEQINAIKELNARMATLFRLGTDIASMEDLSPWNMTPAFMSDKEYKAVEKEV